MPTPGARLTAAARAVFGSSRRFTHSLGQTDAVLRTPLTLCRRISVVQLRGGCGASATAAYLANLLASRRPGAVLAVNAAPGPSGLLWQAGVDAGEPQRASGVRMAAHSSREARDGLRCSPSGAFLLDLWRFRGATGYPTPTVWSQQVAPIARFYDVVVTDWGVRPAEVDLNDVAATGHVTCLLTRADRHAVEQVADVLPDLLAADEVGAVVVAAVDVGHTADTTAPDLAAQLAVPVVPIPYDPARAAARTVDSGQLALRTRLAYAQLAAELVRGAMGTGAAEDVPSPIQGRWSA